MPLKAGRNASDFESKQAQLTRGLCSYQKFLDKSSSFIFRFNRLWATKTQSKKLCTLFHKNILRDEYLTVLVKPVPKNINAEFSKS